jgi:oxygen-independent coproporphyrinogen-3 oxidase
VADPYVDALIRNIEQVAALTRDRRLVHQLHWGGGTPNYLTLPQIERLWQALNQHFTLAETAEISVEVNPAYLKPRASFFLAATGF